MGLVLTKDLYSKEAPYKVIETTAGKVSNASRNTIKGIEIEEGVTTIGGDMFSDCHSLVSVKLPSTLNTLSIDAFKFCTSLKEIVIPEGVDNISFSAFNDCTSLLELSVPESVRNIEYDSFENTPWYAHLSTPSIVGDHLLMTCETETTDGRKTAVIPDDALKVSSVLGISLESDEVFNFKFRGCYFTYHTYYYRGHLGRRYMTHFINETLRIAVSKNYGDEAVDLTQDERFDIAYTVWEQTGQHKALDDLNAYGREFFLHTVENYSER